MAQTRKNKLDGEYSIDFELLGLVSSMKEYKLAWHLNQLGFFHLKKADDIKIEFEGNNFIRISNLVDETEYRSVHLLRNKLSNSQSGKPKYLVPDLQQFDFLLKIKNALDDDWSQQFRAKLKEYSHIDYATLIDMSKIKMKENLIF